MRISGREITKLLLDIQLENRLGYHLAHEEVKLTNDGAQQLFSTSTWVRHHGPETSPYLAASRAVARKL